MITAIDEQSQDIAPRGEQGPGGKGNKMSDTELDAIGAGDQGNDVRFATNVTEEYMPYPFPLAHKLGQIDRGARTGP